jgi:hypothetical protein
MDRLAAVDLPPAGKLQQADLDRAIDTLAGGQHATVARRQLVALGFSPHAVDHVIGRRWLRVVHRGVYAVGPAPLTAKGRWMAAVLAAGPDAVLSHRSAGALRRLGVTEGSGIDVTTARSLRSRPGIVMHRARLAADEFDTVDGIRVTTVARTLLDLAADLPAHQLERAMHEAEVQRLGDTIGLHALIDRHPCNHGTRTLRAILAGQQLGRTITKSELEALFLAFLGDHGLPRPHVNHLIATPANTYECDVVWPQARLIVELDGYATHGTRKRFEQDRARDRALTIAGWRVIRITWRQLTHEPRQLAADLQQLLKQAPAALAC